MNTFIKYISKNSTKSLKNNISITKSKSIGFGGDFLTKYNLQNYTRVTLFFDPEGRKIGFKFCNDGTYKLAKNEKTNTKLIIVRPFFKEYIDVNTEIGLYKPEKVETENFGELFVIELMNSCG